MSELKAHRIDNIISAYKIGKAFCMKTEEEVYIKSEADNVIAHNKHKRCLAMAGKCRLRARWFGDNAFYKKEQLALKWHRRWLELAKKFKEEK